MRNQVCSIMPGRKVGDIVGFKGGVVEFAFCKGHSTELLDARYDISSIFPPVN
jgi:hypothetical protein